MLFIAISQLVLGYALFYTAVDNLTHAGNGHTLWQSLGLTTTITVGDPVTPNQSGQPPQPAQNPMPGGTISI